MTNDVSLSGQSYYTSAPAPVGGAKKRIFDLILSVTALFLLAPLLLLLCFIVLLSSGGPVFFKHRRIGFCGKQFQCLKFRTMSRESDRLLREYLSKNPEALEEWRETRKLRNDPRVTPIGTVLRKLSLDELPQLINIIAGDMSIVGPRPVTQEEVELYGLYAEHYMRTRPGLTGAWQVAGRNTTSFELRVALDTKYVSDWSLWKDFVIVLRTVPAVIFARGSW